MPMATDCPAKPNGNMLHVGEKKARDINTLALMIRAGYLYTETLRTRVPILAGPTPPKMTATNIPLRVGNIRQTNLVYMT